MIDTSIYTLYEDVDPSQVAVFVDTRLADNPIARRLAVLIGEAARGGVPRTTLLRVYCGWARQALPLLKGAGLGPLGAMLAACETLANGEQSSVPATPAGWESTHATAAARLFEALRVPATDLSGDALETEAFDGWGVASEVLAAVFDAMKEHHAAYDSDAEPLPIEAHELFEACAGIAHAALFPRSARVGTQAEARS